MPQQGGLDDQVAQEPFEEILIPITLDIENQDPGLILGCRAQGTQGLRELKSHVLMPCHIVLQAFTMVFLIY
jgi:hypothetical protein